MQIQNMTDNFNNICNIVVGLKTFIKLLMLFLPMKMMKKYSYCWCYSCLWRWWENAATANATAAYEDDGKIQLHKIKMEYNKKCFWRSIVITPMLYRSSVQQGLSPTTKYSELNFWMKVEPPNLMWGRSIWPFKSW